MVLWGGDGHLNPPAPPPPRGWHTLLGGLGPPPQRRAHSLGGSGTPPQRGAHSLGGLGRAHARAISDTETPMRTLDAGRRVASQCRRPSARCLCAAPACVCVACALRGVVKNVHRKNTSRRAVGTQNSGSLPLLGGLGPPLPRGGHTLLGGLGPPPRGWHPLLGGLDPPPQRSKWV